VDDRLGFRSVVGEAGAHARAGGGELSHRAIGDQGGEGDLTYANAAVLEEVATGDVGAGHGWGRIEEGWRMKDDGGLN
jgi:hypothetical protein